MAKKALDIEMSANPDKAIAGMAKTITKLEGIVAASKKVNKESRKAAKGVGKIGKEVDGVGQITQKSLGSIKGWIGGFVGVGSIAAGIKGIVAGLKEIDQFRTKVYDTAIAVDKLVLGVAHLRGDTSQAGIDAARKSVFAVSQASKVPLETAKVSLYASESSFAPGSPLAISSALLTAKTSAVSGATAEDLKRLPKIFEGAGAKTPEDQRRVVNQILTGAKASSSETNEFIKNAPAMLMNLQNSGFSVPEALALYNSAILAEDPAKAAMSTQRLVEASLGKNEAQKKFLIDEAKRRGIDFLSLSGPDRLGFTQKLFHEYGRDRLTGKFDTEAVRSMINIWNPAAERKYTDVLAKVRAGGETDHLARDFKAYETTLIAKDVEQKNRSQISESRLGRQTSAFAFLSKEVNELQPGLLGMAKDLGDTARLKLTPESYEKRKLSRMIIRENLGLAIEGTSEGSEERERLRKLMVKFYATPVLTYEPELVERLGEATDNFSLLKQAGRFSRSQGFEKMREDDEVYTRVIKQRYGIGDETDGGGARNVLLKENTAAVKELTETLKGSIGMGEVD